MRRVELWPLCFSLFLCAQLLEQIPKALLLLWGWVTAELKTEPTRARGKRFCLPDSAQSLTITG